MSQVPPQLPEQKPSATDNRKPDPNPASPPIQSQTGQFQGLNMPGGRIPKCLSCGNVTHWVVEPIITTNHIIIGAVLCVVGFIVSGLVYVGVIYVMRMNEDSRTKSCPICGAKNMWTFQY